MAYIYYNWFGLAADHCLDISQEEYVRHGVSRPHDKKLDPRSVKENNIVFVKTEFTYNGLFQRLILPDIRKLGAKTGEELKAEEK